MRQGYEDWDLWLALADRDRRATYVGAAVYRHRVHEGRRLGADRADHRRIYAELRRRHSELFAQRKELRRESKPTFWKRAAYPIVFGKKHFPVWFEEWLKRQMFTRGLRP